MTFRLRRGMVRETGPGWAVTGADGEPLPGRWADEDTAREQGLLGVYLLSGVHLVEIEPKHQPFRLRRPSVATRRIRPAMWNVYHHEAEHQCFGHIDQTSMSWRSYDWLGRPLDTHRIMTRGQAAQLVADNYRNQHTNAGSAES